MIAILATAFLVGLSVPVIEIAGARALAPYFGTSTAVWTAQMSATLLFLAFGYGLGGRAAARPERVFPRAFVVAGLGLSFFPILRGVVPDAVLPLGISGGAFGTSALLFGLPLLCLGAVSPLLIQRLCDGGLDPARATGSLFFVSTLGALVGGWLAVLWLVPMYPLRWVLAGLGVMLLLLGVLWGQHRGSGAGALLLPLLGVTVGSLGSAGLRTLPAGDEGGRAQVVHHGQGASGLIHVLEVPGQWRGMYINGVDQGAVDLQTGTPYSPSSEYQVFAAHRFHPHARSALVLGLGPGVLSRRLDEWGLQVRAVEADSAISAVARSHFDLPGSVRVVDQDPRSFLSVDKGRYDLIFLDAATADDGPWHMLTREALQATRARLAPGGRLIVSTLTRADGDTEGVRRMEAAALDVFGEAVVFLEPRLPIERDAIVRATVVAGAGLAASGEAYPLRLNNHVAGFVGDMEALGSRPARPGATLDTDERSDLELAESGFRLRVRQRVATAFGAEILQD